MIKRFLKFNESVSVTELDYDYENVYKSSMMINLIGDENKYQSDIDTLGDLIRNTLRSDLFLELFGDDEYRNSDITNFFITSIINKDDLLKMFNNVVVQEGSDEEDEYCATLSINNTLVLLLASPDRGNSIRIGVGEDHKLSFDKVCGIIKELCNIYNEKL